MRKLFTAIAFVSLLAGCNKSIETSTATNTNLKLKRVEFKDIRATNSTQIWTLYYTGDRLTEILSNVGSKATLEYEGIQLRKINYYRSNILVGYHILIYNNTNQLSEVTLQYRNNISSPFRIEYKHTFQYANGNISRKNVYEDNSTFFSGYQTYSYDNDGNLFEVKSYDENNTFNGKYVYVSSSKDNKLKTILPQPQVLAVQTEREYENFLDVDLHFENQYIGQKYIERETMVSAGVNQIVETTNYQLTFNNAGYLTEKTDNTGHFIKYVYE